MTIAIEVAFVVVGLALLVGFVAARYFQSGAQETEKPKRFINTQNVTAELERLYGLFQQGALSHDEYQQLKERLIGGQSPASTTLSEDWRARVEDELRANRKIEAIKLYREATGLGLKESKDAVEEIERSQRIGY